MGEQLFAVVYKKRVLFKATKTGRKREKWEHGFRAPRPGGRQQRKEIAGCFAEKLSGWEAIGLWCRRKQSGGAAAARG